jgi:hypothetical protein
MFELRRNLIKQIVEHGGTGVQGLPFVQNSSAKLKRQIYPDDVVTILPRSRICDTIIQLPKSVLDTAATRSRKILL